MPRLTEGEKHQVIALRDNGMPWSTISTELHLKRSTVRAVYAKKVATGDVRLARHWGAFLSWLHIFNQYCALIHYVLEIYQPQWSRPSSPMHKQNVCE
jgi:orotate phosphoribosyltransferase-like protein